MSEFEQLLLRRRTAVSSQISNQLLNLVTRKRITKSRHLASSTVDNPVGDLFVSPMLLIADFNQGRPLLCTFEIGSMTFGAVVMKKNRAWRSLIRLRSLGRADNGKSEQNGRKNLVSHEAILTRPYCCGAAGGGGTGRFLERRKAISCCISSSESDSRKGGILVPPSRI